MTTEIVRLARMGLSPSEIAEELEVPRTRVAVALFKARGRGEDVPKFTCGYLSLTTEEMGELDQAAAYWEVPPRWLARQILDSVFRGGLVATVLGGNPKEIFDEGKEGSGSASNRGNGADHKGCSRG